MWGLLEVVEVEKQEEEDDRLPEKERLPLGCHCALLKQVGHFDMALFLGQENDWKEYQYDLECLNLLGNFAAGRLVVVLPEKVQSSRASDGVALAALQTTLQGQSGPQENP